MSDPIFIYEGVRAATLTASAGSATGYPTAQLQDDRYSTLWKSGSTAQAQTLAAQFTVARTMDSVFIANHNLANLGLASLDIEVSDNGAAWTLAASLTSFPDPLYATFASVSKLYARLKFVKSSALSAAPQLGLFFIGARVDLPLYSNLPERGLQSDAVVDESISGVRYSTSLHGDRENWKLSFGSSSAGGLKAAYLAAWARFVRGVNGNQFPFWFCDMDSNWHFVRFKKNYLPWIGRGNIRFPVSGIEFDEERVGVTLNLPGSYTINPV
jgi:hypothetical protein